MQGLWAACRYEVAFRQEIFMAIILIPLALVLAKTPIEKVLLITSVLLVLLVELLNSALEAVVNRFGHEYHELSKRAKDMGSAAVFIALLMLGVTWCLVLL